MSKSTTFVRGRSGGSAAIRGFLTQTLVALLDVATADPPFLEITLEPAIGNEQFDFIWTSATGLHATQVKSTSTYFKKSDVNKWAKKMETTRPMASCCLMLVGRLAFNLDGTATIGSVTVKPKQVDLPELQDLAAHRLGKFLETADLSIGTPSQADQIVHAVVSKLMHLATDSKSLSREQLVSLLRSWIVSSSRAVRFFDIRRITQYARANFVGRTEEIGALDAAWSRAKSRILPRPAILTFVAFGGEGKTSLVAKWAARLSDEGWPDCDAAFAWSFYRQGSQDKVAVSSEPFIAEALIAFGDLEMAESPAGACEKATRLAQLIRQRRTLLILDGLEPLQYPLKSHKQGGIRDHGLSVLLNSLATDNSGLCIVTTRYSIPDLTVFRDTAAPEIHLTQMSQEDGVALLRILKVKGNARKTILSSDGKTLLNDYEKLVEEVKGHALTLNLLGTYLRDAHGGDIHKRSLVRLEEADAEEQAGHAFRVMDAYVTALKTGTSSTAQNSRAQDPARGPRMLALLRLLGLFDRPASAASIEALWQRPPIEGLTEPLIDLTEAQRNIVFSRLEAANLITVNRDGNSNILIGIDTHPLIREYFASHLRRHHPKAWSAAHQRLYIHFCVNTREGDNPTLEDLQPLYQAVVHGCLAGMHQDVLRRIWWPRIRRGDDRYTVRKLGAFGSNLTAITYFFESPWDQPVSTFEDVEEMAVLWYDAAFALRALGQSHSALKPFLLNYGKCVAGQAWKWAAILAKNLAELHLTQGKIETAVLYSRKSVEHSDENDEPHLQMITRTTHADIMHQRGDYLQAERVFKLSEEMQINNGLCLRDVPGYRHCDLLIAPFALQSWRHLLGVSKHIDVDYSIQSIVDRVKSALKQDRTDRSLLGIALDHLTLGCADLFDMILKDLLGVSSSGCKGRSSARPKKLANATQMRFASLQSNLEAAVNGLRQSGYQDYLPRGLMARACLRYFVGMQTGSDSAKADLDEAMEISSRGSMELFRADILLHRARLFGLCSKDSEFQYPWTNAKTDILEAEELITRCRYRRRDEELADAKDALLRLSAR